MKDSKEHIIETAFFLFLKKSYKAVTLKNIIEESGLSNGAFYYYFESKEQLFREVIDQYLIQATRGIVGQHPTDSLKVFIQNALTNYEKIFDMYRKDQVVEDGMNFFSFSFEAIRHFPEVGETIVKIQKEELTCWIKIIRLAKEKGEIKAIINNEDLARMFSYMPDRCIMDFIYEGDLDQVVGRIRKLWEGLYEILKK